MLQGAKILLLLGRPVSRATGMTAFAQPGQANLVPALPPLLDAVELDPELIRSFLHPCN
jgi:hypothetical protein